MKLNPLIALFALLPIAAVRAQAVPTLDAVRQQVESGNYAAALSALEQLHSDSPAARFLRGTALADSGRVGEAEKVFNRLIADYPAAPEPYNNLAALYAREGRLDEAKQVLEKAIRTRQSYATVYENLSAVYVEMARDSYVKALRLDDGKHTPKLRMLTALSSGVATPAVKPVVVAKASEEPVPAAKAKPAAPPAAKPAAPEAPATRPAVASTRPAVAETTPSAVAPAPAKAPATAKASATAKIPATAKAPATAKPAAKPAPVQVAKAAPTAPTNKESPPEADPRQAVLATLEKWAMAWSDKDVEGYLSAYVPGYDSGKGWSHKRWETLRRQRIEAPQWIKVELSDVQITDEGPDRMTARVVQDYSTPNYADRTVKRMVLVRVGGDWRIASEENLESERR